MGVKDVRAWVFHVARNLWIDSRRELLRDSSARASLLPRGDSAPDPEQQLLDRERERRIKREIARLPPLQRECVCLKAQGLRYHEIAGALGVSMSAAVDAVRLAVKKLARRLSE